jgi:hypothetical protein
MDALSKSLATTIEESNLNEIDSEMEDILLETSENIFDSLTEEIFNALPILKTIAAVPKVYKGISNYLLTKKIILFLTELSSISSEDRQKFLSEIDSKKRSEIYENLFLVLEKHDSYRKSQIQGKLFRAHIKGEVNENEYESLTYVTSLIDVSRINRLIGFYEDNLEGHENKLNTEEFYSFGFLRLIHIDNSEMGTFNGGGPVFRKNDLGTKFTTILKF